jgi:hypothetical protein
MDQAAYTNTTTRDQAVAALSHVEAVYGRFGYQAGSDTETKLVSFLLQEHDSLSKAQRTADRFRDYIRSIMGGGGTSASVTRKVYADLDRLNETSDNWI